MTVYELMQKLAQYDADTEVRVEITSKGYAVDVVVDEDTKAGEEITSNIDILEYAEDVYVTERTWPVKYVEIQVEI